MAIRIVRLGSQRAADEGPRIGTVRRPPRGVPKTEFARQNWYDAWYPNLAPSAETMKLGQAANAGTSAARSTDTSADASADPGAAAAWRAFEKRYRAEMAEADASRSLDLLAVLSLHSAFSLGCYCEHETRCHRSILRALLQERGAALQA